MALPSGTKLGPYEIVSPLGVGGMGEVYRARDSKLGRDVALKVIAPEFAHDEQRMGRFQREAQVLASLNHTHIASIYGFEDSSGVSALVMELVVGPRLPNAFRAARSRSMNRFPSRDRSPTLSKPPTNAASSTAT
jgi:serine/threonine protein kinase